MSIILYTVYKYRTILHIAIYIYIGIIKNIIIMLHNFFVWRDNKVLYMQFQEFHNI